MNGEKNLPKPIRTKIAEAVEVYVSRASIWEMALKIKLGKLHAKLDELVEAISLSDFNDLSITAKHAAAISQLPDLHRDPFDRMLIAQAAIEPLILLTADSTLQGYSNLIELID